MNSTRSKKQRVSHRRRQVVSRPTRLTRFQPARRRRFKDTLPVLLPLVVLPWPCIVTEGYQIAASPYGSIHGTGIAKKLEATRHVVFIPHLVVPVLANFVLNLRTHPDRGRIRWIVFKIGLLLRSHLSMGGLFAIAILIKKIWKFIEALSN